MQLLIILFLGIILMYLVWKRLIHVDISFAFFIVVLFLFIASISENFVSMLAKIFGIVYEPIAVVLSLIIFIFCIILLMVVFITRLNRKHAELVRKVALIEMSNNSDKIDKK